MDRENAKSHLSATPKSHSVPVQKSGRKPHGTRVGTIEDWREAKPGKRHDRGNQLRDGR